MLSPFPGMNPFLEHPDVWHTFHFQMIAAMSDRLSAQVRPDYLVHVEAHLERQRQLEILDRRNRELVAVVEVLIPVNKKSGPDRGAVLDQTVRNPGFSGAPGRDRLAARADTPCPILTALPARTGSWSVASRSGLRPTFGRSGCDSPCPRFRCR